MGDCIKSKENQEELEKLKSEIANLREDLKKPEENLEKDQEFVSHKLGYLEGLMIVNGLKVIR
jgi:hypothetical protein